MRKRLNYWLNRIKNRINLFTADAEKIADELGAAYFKASKALESEVKKVFKGFQNAFKLSEAEAKELLKKTDGKVPSKAVREAISKITDPDAKRQMEAAISAPAYQYRMKRMDEITEKGKKVCEELAKDEIRTDRAFLRKEAEKAYNHTIFDIQQGTGISGSFTQIPKSRIEQVLKENWSGEHFSERIWGNTGELAEELKQSLVQSFLTGESEQKAAARMQERFGVGAYEARRLIRTENTYVTGQAELQAYKEAKITRYEYAALIDNRTSDICKELDGKIFDVDEAEPGKNYPPMHPFCRSSTLADLPTEEELDKEWEDFERENIPEGMTFDEWLDHLEPTEDGKLVFKQKSVDISVGSGIIKGRSNGNGSHSSEHSFEKIGKVDFNDKNAINTAMNDFEKMCKDSEIEHCRVITVSGDVYDVHGDSDTVDTTLLGDKMRGSINSHNHVTGRSQYSFSKEDIYSSVEDGSRISSAFDEKYKYSMEFNVAVTEDDVYNAYNEATMTVMNRKIFVGDVTDEDEQHEIVKETCRILGIKYERVER